MVSCFQTPDLPTFQIQLSCSAGLVPGCWLVEETNEPVRAFAGHRQRLNPNNATAGAVESDGDIKDVVPDQIKALKNPKH